MSSQRQSKRTTRRSMVIWSTFWVARQKSFSTPPQRLSSSLQVGLVTLQVTLRKSMQVRCQHAWWSRAVKAPRASRHSSQPWSSKSMIASRRSVSFSMTKSAPQWSKQLSWFRWNFDPNLECKAPSKWQSLVTRLTRTRTSVSFKYRSYQRVKALTTQRKKLRW